MKLLLISVFWCCLATLSLQSENERLLVQVFNVSIEEGGFLSLNFYMANFYESKAGLALHFFSNISYVKIKETLLRKWEVAVGRRPKQIGFP